MAQKLIPQLDVPISAIRDFCLRWDVVEFAVFGSALRTDFDSSSDVDVMVTFSESARRSLFEFMRMADELEALFGRKVDLLTRKSLEQSANYLRRDEILNNAQIIYAT